jgi:cyclic pyranopterin phosphate synthase
MSTRDKLDRPLRNLRLSVTDRCNLRCAYCMPEEQYTWLPKDRILRFEEMAELVDVFADVGVDRVRITGGEPLLRRDLPELVRLLAANARIREVALTTNGVRLEQHAAALFEAGLSRVSISLDSLQPDVFRALTRRDDLDRVLAGIEAASRVRAEGLKLDTVVMRGTNDGELAPLIEYARGVGAEVRFIEYMDVGGATTWSMDQVVSRDEMLARLGERYGPIEPVDECTSAPAERFRLSDGLTFGVISSTTAPFCGTCDRSRVTADGMWYLCLYAHVGIDLRKALRSGAPRDELRALITNIWSARADRGAEERLAQADRGVLAEPEALRENPHLEMHKRGG